MRRLLLVVLLVGCRGGNVATARDVEAMQEDEAALDRAHHAAWEAPCSEACAAALDARGAADALCGRAPRDPDAALRCRVARRDADGAAAGAARCACP